MYEVYIGKINNKVMYVGKGKEGRHKHLKSGRSSCKEANKEFFTDNNLEVNIYDYYGDEKAALLGEKNLIETLCPAWNKTKGIVIDPVKDLLELPAPRFYTRVKGTLPTFEDCYLYWCPSYEFKHHGSLKGDMAQFWSSIFKVDTSTMRKGMSRLKRKHSRSVLAYTEIEFHLLRSIHNGDIEKWVTDKNILLSDYKEKLTQWRKDNNSSVHNSMGYINRDTLSYGYIMNKEHSIGRVFCNKDRKVGDCEVVYRSTHGSFSVLFYKTSVIVNKSEKSLLSGNFTGAPDDFIRGDHTNMRDTVFACTNKSGVIGHQNEKLINVLLTKAYTRCNKSSSRTLKQLIGVL